MADTNDAAACASARGPDPSRRDALVVAVHGRVDVARLADLVRRMDPAVASRRPRRHLVCDLAGATGWDLGVVGALARAALAARRRGLQVWVRNPRPELVEMVELVGLGEVLRVWPDGVDDRDPPGA